MVLLNIPLAIGAAGRGEHDLERARWFAPVSVVVVLALGRALQIADGVLHPAAILWVAVSLGLVAAATVLPRPAHLVYLDRYLVPIVGLGGLLLQIGQLFAKLPGKHMQLAAGYETPLRWGLVALGAAGAWAIAGAPRQARKYQILLLVVAHAALGAWVIRLSPSPFIDVFVFQREAIAALRHGIDPYGITFPNIYGHTMFYGDGLSVGGRLQFGFPYFPLSLLVALPGQVFGGDHRYAHLLAMELAAVLMAFARPGRYGAIAAALFLTSPRTFYVLEQSWTDPFVVCGLAAVVFVACRHARAAPWLFGAFVALKQYLVLALPAAMLLTRSRRIDRDTLVFFAKGALVGAAVTLPFVLWNPSGFWHSVITLQMQQPFRTEALSFLAWWAARGHTPPSSLISFAAALIASTVCIWRLPKTAGGFAATIGFTFLAFFAFNKQAFCNYYYFVIGAFATTLAAWEPTAETAALPVDDPVAAPQTPRSTELPRHPRAALAALMLACALPLLWPGDNVFIDDEPKLLALALDANQQGRLAEFGLLGTYGVVYGPGPVWLYQAFVALTHDVVLLTVAHVILIAGVTGVALWWLSRSLGLWIWFAPIPLLSPYFWFYARALWDNTLLIPLGALTIASYTAFLNNRSPLGLRIAVAGLLAMPLVHLMSLSLVVPLGAHMLLVNGRWLWKHRLSVAAIVCVLGLAGAPYWIYLATEWTKVGSAPAASGLWFPLLGGRLLSARGVEYLDGWIPRDGTLFGAASAASSITYGLVWLGIVVAGGRVVRALRSRHWATQDHVAVLALSAMACQVVLDGMTGKFQHPHYQNGTWIIFVVLAWLAVDTAIKRGSGSYLAGLVGVTGLATVLLISVGAFAYRTHIHGGTREVYGATIANQQEVARSLSRYSLHSPLLSSVVMRNLYPHAIDTLRRMNQRGYGGRPVRDLELRYASDDPASGVIELVER
jgi:hypothetical protein